MNEIDMLRHQVAAMSEGHAYLIAIVNQQMAAKDEEIKRLTLALETERGAKEVPR